MMVPWGASERREIPTAVAGSGFEPDSTCLSRERVVVSTVFLPENQLGTDLAKPLVGRRTATPAAGPPLEAGVHDTSKNRRRESNPPATVPEGPPPVRWLRQQHAECPRQESNLVCDLRRVACDPAHSKDKRGQVHFPVRRHTASAVGSPPGRSPGGDAVCLTSRQCPRQESNLVYDLRKVACVPAHSKDIHQHPTEESNLVRRLRTPSCVPQTRRARREFGRPTGLTPVNSLSNCRSRARTGLAGLMKADWAPAHLQ